MEEARLPQITVVVCSHNGASRIAATLEALTSQTLDVPVIVVDDGSTDETVSVVQRFTEDVQLVRANVNIGLSAARNLGLKHVQTELVAFCDDDCRPMSTWVEGLLEAWNGVGDNVMAIGGDVVSFPLDSVARRYLLKRRILAPLELAAYTSISHRVIRQFLPPRDFDAREKLGSVVGANMSFRMGALRKIGNFNEDIRFGGDEEYVSVKLREEFGPDAIEFAASLTMSHEFDSTLRQQWRREWRYGLGVGRKWVLEGGLPALPLPMCVSVLIGLIVGLSTSWLLGASAVLVSAYALRIFEALPGQPLERLAYPFFSVVGQILSFLGICVGVIRNLGRSSR